MRAQRSPLGRSGEERSALVVCRLRRAGHDATVPRSSRVEVCFHDPDALDTD